MKDLRWKILVSFSLLILGVGYDNTTPPEKVVIGEGKMNIERAHGNYFEYFPPKNPEKDGLGTVLLDEYALDYKREGESVLKSAGLDPAEYGMKIIGEPTFYGTREIDEDEMVEVYKIQISHKAGVSLADDNTRNVEELKMIKGRVQGEQEKLIALGVFNPDFNESNTIIVRDPDTQEIVDIKFIDVEPDVIAQPRAKNIEEFVKERYGDLSETKQQHVIEQLEAIRFLDRSTPGNKIATVAVIHAPPHEVETGYTYFMRRLEERIENADFNLP